MRFKCWTILILALPLALGTACTGGNDASGNVNVTVKATYEKVAYGSGGLGSVTSAPARYAYAQLCRTSDDTAIQGVDLDANGMGTISIPRDNVYAVVYADVAVPNGSDLLMQGSVIPQVPLAHYSAAEFKALVPWYVSSDSFTADSSGTISVRALESTGEAGAFAIADQMVEFALGMHKLEPTLPLPNLHAFWTSGTGDTNPTAVTDTKGDIIRGSYSSRPILATEIPKDTAWPAVAYNDGRLLETFARGLFATGSTWTQTVGEEGSLVRADNDNAFIDLGHASEPSIAFMSGFSHFLSCAIRNDAHLYDVKVQGTTKTLRLDQSTGLATTDGGEFHAASVARTLWDIWKNALGGGTSGLTTMWNATIPNQANQANQALEYGNAPLACYPTYLIGLTRLAGNQGGSVVANAIRAEMPKENIGGSNGDVTDPLGVYYNTTPSPLWIARTDLPLTLNGTLTHNPANRLDAYERSYAQTYWVFNDGNNRTISLLSTGGPGLLVELFDSIGYLAYAKAPGSPSTISLPKTSGRYAIRVRLDPSKPLTGASAPYTLTIQ